MLITAATWVVNKICISSLTLSSLNSGPTEPVISTRPVFWGVLIGTLYSAFTKLNSYLHSFPPNVESVFHLMNLFQCFPPNEFIHLTNVYHVTILPGTLLSRAFVLSKIDLVPVHVEFIFLIPLPVIGQVLLSF